MPLHSHDGYSRVEVSFPHSHRNTRESLAVLRISHAHDQLSFSPTMATRNTFSRLYGLRNLNTHMGNTGKQPAD